MNDRTDRPDNTGRPPRSDGWRPSRGGNDRNHDRGGYRSDRGSRDDRGARDDRGGYRSDRDGRGSRDDRGGYRSDRSGRDDRGGYRSDRGARDDRGGFPSDRNDRGTREDHGGYRSDRGNRGSNRPDRPNERRDDRNRHSYDRGRDSERPSGQSRSGQGRDGRNGNGQYRDGQNGGGQRRFGEDRGYRGERKDRDDRGGYRSERPSQEGRSQYRSERGERRGEHFDRQRDSSGNREQKPYREGARRPYEGGRTEGDRRPFRNDRDGHSGQRDDRGGFRNDRGGFRDDRGGGRNDRYGRDSRDPRGRGGTRGGGRSDRGGAEREFTEEERLRHSLRPVRSEHDDPVIADHIRPNSLHPAARNELKTLQPEVQERVAMHLAMAAELIDDDPELAHQHAISASRRAGRIPVTRETLGITAYRTGDFALAIRELRTFRRLSGRDSNIAIMVDSERGLGRPEKAIETGLEVDPSKLETADRVYLAIAMSGARLDLGQTQQALFELEISELDPSKAFSWSPELFGAYGAVLEDLGRTDEAAEWFARADRAAAALEDHFGALDELEVIEIEETEGTFEETEGTDEITDGSTDTDDSTDIDGSSDTDGDSDIDIDAGAEKQE